ncbi:molybdopterin-dependent oxidoreductase [Mycobacterium antarcticum]|uniref:molybdopterin-dependent oxidoreductase n=1 Tax=Mycolicibacterium sp. TUM20984 TaxID=3023368 RepID=UPI0023A250D1|nr:molybdopterin-dependent oxidoreductase [Mycolicibacterium sp. TUM20984]GLP83123.1 membrane protein [Mycolicibacterium sp. TUM20984]
MTPPDPRPDDRSPSSPPDDDADPGLTDDVRANPQDSSYGFPAPAWQALEEHPPPGLSRIRWRSPLRGPWLTSVFGACLLIALPIVIVTGLLSYIAYGPGFGQAIPADVGWLKLPTFEWPTSPSWLYRLNQGLHVGLGLIIIPVVLAKLWSVIPRLFVWPPARSIAAVLERISLLMLVGGILFEIVTGVLNIQYDYIFGFSFYTAHYFGAWVFIAGFVAHVCLKLPKMVRSLRSRSMRTVLSTSRADTEPEPMDEDRLVAADPDPPTLSRRGALAVVGGGSVLIAVLTVGQTLGGFTRPAALLLPRGRSYGGGPNDFQINRTAAAAAIDPATTGDTWRLELRGGSAPVILDRAALAAMPQHTAELPIACVEGWSTTQTWTGVRLADLAAAAGLPQPGSAVVTSLEKAGAFARAMLQGNQVLDPDSLLALKVNGADLSMDHGYPARVIVPAMPGVHNTKWVAAIEFRGA